MEDRELLELAAKAFGFGSPGEGAVLWTESEYPKGSGNNGALWNYVGWCDTAQLWNPLTDDGDALRLAVKLRMLVDVMVDPDDSHTEVVWPNCYTTHGYKIRQGHSGLGDEAATRRAIVRAAAEIGKALNPQPAS